METIDPVLRCDSCQMLVKHADLKKIGCCQHCGNKRVRSVTVATEEELGQIKAWGFSDMADGFKEVRDDE